MSFVRRAVALAAISWVAGAAHAEPITTNQWYYFSFGDTGSPLGGSSAAGYATGPIIGANTTSGTWDITLTSASELFWTDLQISGDRFEFFDGATSLGTSGADVPGGTSGSTDIAAALADANYGKGSVILGPGTYSLRGEFLGVITFGDGAFIVRDLTVPAPTTTALVGLALAGLGLLSRRRA